MVVAQMVARIAKERMVIACWVGVCRAILVNWWFWGEGGKNEMVGLSRSLSNPEHAYIQVERLKNQFSFGAFSDNEPSNSFGSGKDK